MLADACISNINRIFVVGNNQKDNNMENRVNEHDFEDIVEVMQAERQSQLPRYADLMGSIIGEATRVSEQKAKQAFGENISEYE